MLLLLGVEDTRGAVGIHNRFVQSEASGGIILMFTAAAALLIANTPLASDYFSALHYSIFGLSIAHWVNDGLMAIFFLLVGLEIKREMISGELSSWPRRILPGFAAVGGMAVPAIIYVSINWNNPETLRGWAIPTATDIAFALGVLSLLGSRVPSSLKIFLAALAILDDLGAVVIIAIFYTSDLSNSMLLASLVTLLILILLNGFSVTKLRYYLPLGALLWFFVLQSGIHATLAGVALALCIPLKTKPENEQEAPLLRLEHSIHPWVGFLVVPIFGFTNAGVALGGISASTLLEPLPMGVILGLFFGKQIGVFLMTALAIKSGLAYAPKGASWRHIYAISLLCGIGFTMSLFIGGLAFPDRPLLIDQVKVGVILGSLLAGVAGVLLLWSGGKKELV